MKKLDPTMAQQIAQAVSAFQQRRTGYAPKAVTVVLSEDTLVVTLHEALVARREGPGPHPGRGRSGAGVSPAALQATPPTCCGRRSSGSPGSRWARRPRKSRRQPAPSCMHSRPARWCRCSSLPAGSPRRPGTGVDETIHHKKRRFCHVSSIEEESGIGRGRRGRWLSSPAEGHGARNSRHTSETGLRGRCRTFPSIVSEVWERINAEACQIA